MYHNLSRNLRVMVHFHVHLNFQLMVHCHMNAHIYYICLSKAVTRIFSGGVTLSLIEAGGSGEGCLPPQKIFAFFISEW